MRDRPRRILGLWSMGDSQGFHERKDPRIIKDIIKCAWRNGVDTFDSAFSYKDSDSMLCSSMKEMHITEDRYHVIGKVMPLPSFEKKVETELRRLGRSYMDALLIHWPTEENLFPVLKSLERMESSGKALRIGVSNFPPALSSSISNDFHITLQERAYSPLSMAGMDKETLPLLLYGCYGFGCLLKDSVPEDRRGNLYFYREGALERFRALRKKIRELSAKYGTSDRAVLLSFAEETSPEGIILGAGSTYHAECLYEEAAELGKEDIKALKMLGEGLSSFNPSDNVFSHQWK